MSLLDKDEDFSGSRQREFTLGTGPVLAIFCGLLLLCGLFFAFGYNLGSRTHAAGLPPESAPVEVPSAVPSVSSISKPHAGSSAAILPSNPAASRSPVSSIDVSGVSATISKNHIASTEGTPSKALLKPQPVTIHPTGLPPSGTHGTLQAAEPSPTGTFLVQVAAVSHQQDAQLLVGALKARGYAVAARTSPADSFFHVQVGPFPTKKDAEAMRQRLLADGYNAVLK